ncbi:unnamed protein product [Kuraishia capsulata CBS 1993]|uniref:Mannose-P-dolichol utilization defect 1 protein homolog n=1 Tax=Kuraishia capsulata CBS 1993 TaxID=1382522 RepID=W6MSC2_9ASCO|nr:uncharacterized protein KUCA_T00004083001 [Kuraishia capsulata CBS 1993]CDK28102.1 unnamed protein product [Kuraishia capsulata CBS 1993]
MDNIQQQLESVLAVLRPYTHFIPEELRILGGKLIGDEAFEVLVMELDPFSPEGNILLKPAISKVLGLGLIGGSSIVKLPQILSVIRSKSAEGISLLTTLLESFCYLVSLSSNFRSGTPFLAFGEVAFMLVQNLFLAVLLLGFGGKYKQFQFFFSVVSILLYTFLAQPSADKPLVIGNNLLNFLQSIVIPLSGLSKIPQVIEIFKRKSTGQLSSITVLSNLLASVARIFTTLSSGVAENSMLIGFLVAGLVNVVLGIQLFVYGSNKSASPKVKTS